MSTFNPLAPIEGAIGGAIIELIKLTTEDHRDFEQVFEDTLRQQLKKSGKRNTSIVRTALKRLLSDPDVRGWLDGAQLPRDAALLDALAARLQIDAATVQEFFVAYEIAIVKNDTLRDLRLQRLGASQAQSLQDILRAVSGERTAAQSEAERAAIRTYCARVRRDFATIMLFGDRKRGDDSVFARMADMARGFIPLHLKPWRDDDATTAEPLAIDQVFFDHAQPQRFLLRGLPGSGKTTLLRYLAWRFAGDQRAIPVYLRLKHLNLDKKSLPDFIKQGIKQVCPNKAIESLLLGDDRLLESPMVLLLDGIDEIEDSDSHSAFAETLDELARDYPRCTIVIASRPIGLRKEDYREFTPLDLDVLAPEMVDAYIDAWFGGDAAKIAALRDTLAAHPRMQALAHNPFLLSMICFTYAEGGDERLVTRRSALYAECTEFLLDRLYDRDAAKPPAVDREKAKAMLKDLALRFFLWQESDFPVDQVNVLARRFISPRQVRRAEKFLDRVQKDTGLLQRAQEGFTFVHRTLWEYFAALALLDKKPEFVIRHAANPDWEEVVRLYAGLLPEGEKVEKLVHGLWQINRPLALRATTELATSAAELLQPLIAQEASNQGKLLLIEALEQSLPLLQDARARRPLVEETLDILLIGCDEKDCEVIYHAQRLLEKVGLQPLAPGGLLYRLFELEHAAARQQALLNDPANHFAWIDVPGGRFWMGDDEHETDEKPAHQVELHSFRLAKHPVTNRMLAGFRFGQKFPNYGGDSNPAIGNTWYEAYYFCLWIGARLPSEAEWEYAARGGPEARRTQYYFGDEVDELANHAWFGDSSRRVAHAVDEHNPRTGRENLNPLGLANMLGNVREWCADWYGADYYKDSPAQNPPGPENGSLKVLRGGSWYNDPNNLRCADRDWNNPTDRSSYSGFRCAQDVH